MPHKQTRGPLRDRKRGLRKDRVEKLDGPQTDKIAALLERTIEYLESELNILLVSPGCHKEVLAIAKGLEAIRASQSGGPATPSIRSEFDLGA